MIDHEKADEIIQGKGWESGKGCFIGCSMHEYNHKKFETDLNLPQWLGKLADRIFEGLPNSDAKKFAVNFYPAINVGANLEKIKIPMLIFIVESAREKTKNERSLKAIDGVLNELKKEVLDLEKLKIARRAAATAAATAAAYAAAAAAAAYARENEYKKLAEKLIDLMKSAT